MNCRGLFASALITTQQQHIKLPHICIPKAYTYLHLFSSHLGYVVRKCYDFKTTACCFTLFGDHSVRKNSLWSVRKIETHEQSPIWWDLLNEIGMHENLRVFTAESCQWRRYCTLLFSANLRVSLSVRRYTSASKFIARANGPVIPMSIEAYLFT